MNLHFYMKTSFFWSKPITEQCVYRNAPILRCTICTLMLSIINEKLAPIRVWIIFTFIIIILMNMIIHSDVAHFLRCNWMTILLSCTHFRKKNKKKNIWIVRNGHVNVFLSDRTENLCLRENCEFRSHDQEEYMFV